ncbi:hypothetical protein N0V93_002125 [Gnomoniopsis smithogilvyi]|uniref:DUF7888 domain-containing protein n=1 Tax=Gnomoniopsis smithogilvyi TaxID=1191159 RepID=A0A9W8Z786_9PEZI|nr:hypothetical protein N0V93_002125 [Gnomoniopsis smithogilvyi]
MRFSATLYALTIATSAIASPLHAARATDQDIVDEESTKVINGEPSEVIQILEPETDAGSTLTEELIVEINDPDYVSTKMLKERINTKGASNVAYGQAIAAAVDAAYTQAKQIKNWDKARQAFTQGMVGSMSARNPDFGKAKAAVCYNQGYRIRDPSNYYGLRSVSFSSGLLKTK